MLTGGGVDMALLEFFGNDEFPFSWPGNRVFVVNFFLGFVEDFLILSDLRCQ